MIPARIEDAWTIEGAVWRLRSDTNQTVEHTASQISELEEAARQDWLALGSTQKERRQARIAEITKVLEQVGAKRHAEKPRTLRRRKDQPLKDSM